MMWVRKGPLQQGAHTIEDKPKRKVRCGIRQGKKPLLYAERQTSEQPKRPPTSHRSAKAHERLAEQRN